MIREVPTPEEISTIPGLSHLSSKFPKKQNWPTILLLGRDCIHAFDQMQQTQSEDKHQRATKTPLGWAIIGKPAPSTRPLKKNASSENKATPGATPHSNTVLKTTATPTTTPYSTSTKKPTYAQVTKQKRRSTPPNNDVDVDLLNTRTQAYIQRYAAEEDRLATAIQGNKEEELPGYTQDEIMFLKDVIN